MYILSALFKDTRIGESVLEYAERALMTAINGFDSVFWNVRNASTLLFSSLVNRIFGVNRSKEEISKKNRFSIKLDLIIKVKCINLIYNQVWLERSFSPNFLSCISSSFK